MKDPLHIVCPACLAVNRIPEGKLAAKPKCGKCHQPVLDRHPVELNSGSFRQHIQRNDIPVVVDFWAPWCGPCKMMAPAFEEAAAQLAPDIRLAKLNTEVEQTISANLGIRSIPTMIIFRHGKEVARQAGAMGTADIVRWIRAHT
ncbi:MAG: thioredoxin TrxC [Gammaproteobacteria bacterium]|nr:MAG: thioredoxin TrxC [Gammaproteobacteria bacterium]